MSVLNLTDLEDLVSFLCELVLASVGILLLFRLYERAYGPPRYHNGKLRAMGVLAILTVTFIMRMLLPYFRPASIYPVNVLCSLLFLWAYPTAGQKKVFYSLTLFTVSCLWVLLWDMITSPIPYDMKNIWLILFTGHIIFWIMIELVRLADNGKQYKIPGVLWLLLAANTFLSMLVFSLIEYYVLMRIERYAVTIEIPVILVFLFFNMSLFVFFDRFTVMMQTEWENGLLDQQLQLQNNHYKALETSQNEIRKLHHDMKNYVQTAVLLAEKDDVGAELKQFLASASGQLTKASQVISTGNASLDSILNIKLEELRNIRCRLELDIHVPPDLRLTFEESVTILGNLLDNAAEALRNFPKEERWLSLHLSYSGGALFIRIENAATQIARWQDDLPATTKENREFHGLGLKNVKKTVETTGTMDVISTTESFTVKILLYDR